MFKLRLALTLPARSQNLFQYAAFNSSAPINSLRPPLDLDPTLEALLKQEDMSLSARIEHHPPKAKRELEVISDAPPRHELSMDDWTPMDISESRTGSKERKSPAALLGSQRIGMVILPLELHSAIKKLINGMHPAKMAIIIDHIGPQTETNHKFTVMPNDCSILTQMILRNLSGTPSMNRTIVPDGRLFVMAQEMELPLLLLPFRHIIPP